MIFFSTNSATTEPFRVYDELTDTRCASCVATTTTTTTVYLYATNDIFAYIFNDQRDICPMNLQNIFQHRVERIVSSIFSITIFDSRIVPFFSDATPSHRFQLNR